MQILGIYINEEYNYLKKGWYGFYSEINWHEKFDKHNISKEDINIIKENQKFLKKFYRYKGDQISINCIVGKNGSGKSTLLEIYNKIINNFAYSIKTLKSFQIYNEGYDLGPTEPFKAELYYENNNKIYCIKNVGTKALFYSNEESNLYTKIKTLEDLSNHCFYTVATNYSLYSENPEWLQTLFHKNDGYFTPIVLVPYRKEGNIEFVRENILATKRVFTLALLLCKESKSNFIEQYRSSRIGFVLKDEEYYKQQNYIDYQEKKFSNYKEEVDSKIQKLKEYNSNRNKDLKEKNKKVLISDTDIELLHKEITQYWNGCLSKKHNPIIPYCINYLIYKTLKSFTNYETLAKLLDFGNLKTSLKTNIEKELWDENNINYMNLKILMCKRFIEYSYKNLYSNSFVDIEQFLKKKKIKDAKTYHEIFTYLLPDFYETHFYYKKDNEQSIIELTRMSSGEQHLYNSLSYIVYHIINAQSNEFGNKTGKIPYKYFNLMFDEAELYYHPEYQRKFISNLIQIIDRSNLGIKGLNITIVTHSPYIISDVLKTNILALENGDVSEKLNQTLAANIYDLLGNQFFMDSYIGECSKNCIEAFIKEYKEKEFFDTQTYTFYKKFIQNIGDEYLGPTLTIMLEERNNGSSFENRKEEYYKAKIKAINKSEK